MSKMMILELPVSSIDVPDDRARDYDEAQAQMLADVIAVQGLHHPIRVRQNGDRYTLISGRHRLQAFELNQSASIPATVSTAETDDDARMEEVMENLARNELTALDRCHHLYELKVVWDRMHPDFANGGGQTLPTGQEQPEIFGFASEVAERVGLAKRTINHAVKIWGRPQPGLSPAAFGHKARHQADRAEGALRAVAGAPGKGSRPHCVRRSPGHLKRCGGARCPRRRRPDRPAGKALSRSL